MAEQKDKIISYRRAAWVNDGPGSVTLERCIRDAHNVLKTVEDGTIVRDSGQCLRPAKIAPSSYGGVFLHITADTPGEEASVVTKVKAGSTEIQVGTTHAPTDSEFMDGDAFVYVNGDDVCLCMTSMREGGLKYFLYEFFRKAKIRKDATQFDLVRVANFSKIKFIRSQKVKEIEIKALLSQATANYQRRKDQAQGILGATARQLRSFAGSPHDVTNDSLRVSLTLKVDRRFNKHIELGEKRIEQVAVDLVNNRENDDDFRIVTKTGQVIGPDEIFIKSKVGIDKKGKSVEKDKAWAALLKFYKTLQESGALER